MDTKYPEVVVGAFIRDRQGNILLVRSHKWPGRWVVGGGHIDHGETIKDALIREVKEEYGFEVEFKRIIKVVEIINSPYFSQKDRHFVGMQCECLALNPKELKLDNLELHEAKWFTLEEATKLKDAEPVAQKTILEMYLEESNAKK